MPVRTDEEVREALEAQADDNQHAGELLDILRWSSAVRVVVTCCPRFY